MELIIVEMVLALMNGIAVRVFKVFVDANVSYQGFTLYKVPSRGNI